MHLPFYTVNIVEIEVHVSEIKIESLRFLSVVLLVLFYG
jgi:hypothetical protein